MQLPQLPADKANHFFYGSLAAAIAVPIGAHFGFPSQVSALIGSASAGAVKELADAIENAQALICGEAPVHSVDFYDFMATAAGGLPVASVGAL
jgi:hypothetical protein